MSDTSGYSIGVDLGGTNVKLVAADENGTVLRSDRFGTEDQPAAKWLQEIRNRIATLEQQLGAARAVGVAAPGLASGDGRSIRWMMGRLEPVMGLDWTTQLQRSQPVRVLNDAHAALLAEQWLGAARGCSNAVLLTLGTGVGGAILCDGKLLRGHLGRAGHLGHLSLDPDGNKDIVNTPGSLEEALGECTLRARCGGKFSSTRELLDGVAAGDPTAVQVWERSVKALAAGIASIINAVDPEVVILGGGIAQAGDALLRPLRRFLDEFEWRPTGESVRIERAVLGDLAGALGAAHAAMENVQ